MKTLRYILGALMLLALMQISSCSKDTYPDSFAPGIKTGSYSDVYRKGATIYGNISLEDYQMESFGMEYTTLTRPGLSIEQYFATAQQMPVDSVDEEGNFSVALENLEPGKIYLYRSYVNSGYTTVYGADSSFQTPKNNAPVFGHVSIDSITYTSFNIEVPLLDDGGDDIEQMAFIYKEVSDENQQVELNTGTPDIQTLHIKQADKDNNYNAVVKNLRSGTTYMVRPYAVAFGIGYGQIKYISTKLSNETLISECDTFDLTISSIRLQASILAQNNQFPVSEVGFCYSMESQEPTVEHLLLSTTRTGDNFETVLNDLELNADYYVRAYAKQSDGEYIYGDVLHYKHQVPADATFLSKCEVNLESKFDRGPYVVLNAAVLHQSSLYSIKSAGFCYSTESKEPTLNNLNVDAIMSDDSLSLSAELYNLEPGNRYYIRAYAKQSNDEYVYGEVLTYDYEVPSYLTVLSKCDVSYEFVLEADISYMSLKASIEQRSDVYSIDSVGFCYSTENQYPTINNNVWHSYWENKDENSFSGNIHNVLPDVRYYIRAYAKHRNGEYAYGPVTVYWVGSKPVTYTLRFDGNGGNGWMYEQFFEPHMSQEIRPNSFERYGYEFVGWNTADDGSGVSYEDRQSITLISDMTLYAQWQAISGTENGHEYVDLGLPSGTLWAACNVGADAPHEYGNHYAWGETSTKSNYDWSTYKYGTERALTKYGPDGKTMLDAEDDAANVYMDGRWRMPSIAQFEELRTLCTWTWTSLSGVNGYKVTSSVNGNSIFLPAAGDRNGTQSNFAGSYGYYWSRSLAADSSLNAESAANAEYLYFLGGRVGLYANHRVFGHSVRAVISKTVVLSFDANGGQGSMSELSFEAGIPQAIPTNAFTRADYDFVGWNTAPDGSGTAYRDGQEITLSEDITLYAQWAILRGVENGHNWVNLGLPSGTLWATYNVGATTPEGLGHYFAWGETAPKSEYSLDSYIHYNVSTATLSKYNTISGRGPIDNKLVLDLSDDAARVNMGGKWRMPTSEEHLELIKHCVWTATVQNGVSGYIVKSKSNGNSIFLPFAGYHDETSDKNQGGYGDYWSSSLNKDHTGNSCYMVLRPDLRENSDAGYRYYGRTVRAVFSENDTPSSFVTLTFNANGGQGTMPVQHFEASVAQAVFLNHFNRDGFAFAGWNTAPDGSGTAYSDGQEISLSDNLTLYAQWKATQVVSGTENGHDYVDLGLPSGTKWATCNVGATTPEAYGDYFAWGETSPKDDYSWETYKYCNGSVTSLTKYNTSSGYGTIDNKTTLDLSDDAACVNWGGTWRMPSRADQDELRNNCTWTWITQNGVKGYKVASKTNGNSIFLPEAGYRNGTSVGYVGSGGFYWSSSLDELDPHSAHYLIFNSGDVGWRSNYRRRGHTVRAVCP